MSNTLQGKVEHLPEVMAQIMEEGLFALELMDGDVSHVPVLWVKVVIENLKVSYGRNKKRRRVGRYLFFLL